MTATYFLRNNAVDYDITSFELNKELARAINTCKASVVKTDGANFSIGDEPSLIYWDGADETVLFSGRITDKSEDLTANIIFESFGGTINHITVDEIYDDKSPEFIAADLIDNNTDLTYASVATSGIVIKRFVVNTDTIGDAISRLNELVTDWHIRSDNDKNFYFEPRNTTNSAVDVTINSNAQLTSQWNRNPDKIVNKITLVGDVQTFSTDQDGFTAAGAETTTTLSYKPKGNVLITKDGVELVGGVEDGTSSPDFTVDRDNAKITYTVPLVLNEVITIFYEYEVPVKITAQNDASVALFSERATKVTDKTVRTMDDARIWVQNYLASNSLEDIAGEFVVDINRNINVGELLLVVDDFNNINQTFLVNSVITKYPLGLKTIKVGRVSFDQLINDIELKNRLKKLEQEFDNTDLIQLYREIVEQINIVIYQTYKITDIDINNSFALDDPINGLLGTTTSKGGFQVLQGDKNKGDSTFYVKNINNIFYEPFDATTYIDTDNTDATIDTVDAQAEFTAGQVVTSKSIFKNEQIALTTTPTLEIASGVIKIESSNNNGVTWNDVTNNVQFTFPFYDFDIVGGNILKEDGFKILQENGNGILVDILPTEKELLYRLTENDSSTAVVTSAKFTYTV